MAGAQAGADGANARYARAWPSGDQARFEIPSAPGARIRSSPVASSSHVDSRSPAPIRNISDSRAVWRPARTAVAEVSFGDCACPAAIDSDLAQVAVACIVHDAVPRINVDDRFAVGRNLRIADGMHAPYDVRRETTLRSFEASDKNQSCEEAREADDGHIRQAMMPLIAEPPMSVSFRNRPACR